MTEKEIAQNIMNDMISEDFNAFGMTNVLHQLKLLVVAELKRRAEDARHEAGNCRMCADELEKDLLNA